MTIQDALKTGKPFKNKKMTDYICLNPYGSLVWLSDGSYVLFNATSILDSTYEPMEELNNVTPIRKHPALKDK